MQMKALKFAIAIYEKALEEMSQQTEAKREKKCSNKEVISAHIIKTEVNLDLETIRWLFFLPTCCFIQLNVY